MESADLILYNGRIYTKPSTKKSVQAIAVSDGRVSDVGSDRKILELRTGSVKAVDLKGRVVLPGLSDSHVHLLGYGMFLRTLDLTKAASVWDVQDAVRAEARTSKAGSWIIGRGWDQEKLREGRFLNSRDFESFVDHPIYLKRVCGHVAVANKLALSIARVNGKRADPKGGEIERDRDGAPTGLLKESALHLIEDKIPWSEESARNAIEQAAEKLLRFGVTSLHCVLQDLRELRVLRLLKKQGRVRQSVYAIIPAGLLESIPKAEFKRRSRGFRVGGVKVYLDGSLGARTAALEEPYSDEPGSTGMMTTSKRELEKILRKTSSLGTQVCIHCIGDRALATAVTGIEQVSRSSKSYRITFARPRIEHASLTPSRLLPRMRRMGLVASVQPRFIYSDNWAVERIGRKRSRYLYPFRSMLKAGLHLAAGSDAPNDGPNPFDGVWSAVRRPGLPSRERLTVSQALSAYTTGAAYASFSEHERGTLEPGKIADMVLLDRDPFTCPVNQLNRVKVVETIIAGVVTPRTGSR